MSNPSPLYGVFDYFKAAKREDFKDRVEQMDYLTEIKEGRKIERPLHNLIRDIDCYHGIMDGYSYKSNARLHRQRTRELRQLHAPSEEYRFPVTENMKSGWFYTDKALMCDDWWRVDRSSARAFSDESKFMEVVLEKDQDMILSLKLNLKSNG